jgi:hypothetical protein
MNAWIAVGVVAGCLAGCATTAKAPTETQAAPVAAARAGCVTDTGSRIPGAECSGPGRSYSQTDIANTGQTTAADALRLLDPSVTVHR